MPWCEPCTFCGCLYWTWPSRETGTSKYKREEKRQIWGGGGVNEVARAMGPAFITSKPARIRNSDKWAWTDEVKSYKGYWSGHSSSFHLVGDGILFFKSPIPNHPFPCSHHRKSSLSHLLGFLQTSQKRNLSPCAIISWSRAGRSQNHPGFFFPLFLTPNIWVFLKIWTIWGNKGQSRGCMPQSTPSRFLSSTQTARKSLSPPVNSSHLVFSEKALLKLL